MDKIKKIFKYLFIIVGVLSFLFVCLLFFYSNKIRVPENKNINTVEVNVDEQILYKVAKYPIIYLNCSKSIKKMEKLKLASKEDFYSILPDIKKLYPELKTNCEKNFLMNENLKEFNKTSKIYIYDFEEEYNYYYNK